MSDTEQDDFPDDGAPPSKSARKREMTARQDLGVALCELSPKELARIPIEDEALLTAIEESRRISHHSALRRHRQFIGKLMRRIDPEPLQQALDELHRERQGAAAAHHALERLRDELIARGDDALGSVLARFPGADRQRLRQLLREAQRERDGDRPPAASRRLFRYLRELEAAS
ncbi:MAG: ribosome biogenesis factor YjgA [Halieaceae bacterium]|jgi:ribosome-associated protein|nr:ribosome biogenesis factor YjgA [Halieaceae bacterium]